MRLGIFGGTFDPIHIGHLVVAQVALEEASLDRVLFVPAGVNPLKVGRSITDGSHRLAMVQRALQDCPQFTVTSWELDRPGPSFTVETVLHVREQYPDAELFLIIGADNLRLLPKWKSVENILEQVTILALNRPGEDLKSSCQMMLALYPHINEQIRIVDMPGLDISSTWLRDRLVKNLSVKHLLPAEVIRYSEENKLYERRDDQ
ncbi:nicotinate-nucleotide adenylyltransferase [Tumebacillus permanentifrigoris]|uniref:Probable nicotinate-nucleotide adenylyltransferase n=1 Tax=Tumebacillus permanentifrigoris TaxID=378543 RepID=A0A316DDD9_9BACL|nr:nicotinate-nucleotide adenylyltransferase [Tumebacillus permanentifrigoris]PWK16024.1 nicotinate-nucleotide adenylyltransferase [Tumebacillus permanentifrigoris]